MTNWMICKVKYQSIDEATRKDKTFNSQYLIDSINFTEAESKITTILTSELNHEFVITEIDNYKVNEVFVSDDGDKWYKCKVSYIDVNPNTGKEKRTNTYDIIYAYDIKDAFEKLEDELSQILIPWECSSIIETKIIDVFPYDESDNHKYCVGETL